MIGWDHLKDWLWSYRGLAGVISMTDKDHPNYCIGWNHEIIFMIVWDHLNGWVGSFLWLAEVISMIGKDPLNGWLRSSYDGLGSYQ
jgi:hypothetical protein